MNLSRTLHDARRNVRRWGQMWRIMSQRRDYAGARFAVERGQLWRRTVNTLLRVQSRN